MPDGRSTYRYPSRIFDPAIGVCSGLMVYLAHRGTFGTQWYILYLVHHHGIFGCMRFGLRSFHPCLHLKARLSVGLTRSDFDDRRRRGENIAEAWLQHQMWVWTPDTRYQMWVWTRIQGAPPLLPFCIMCFSSSQNQDGQRIKRFKNLKADCF